MNALKAPTSTVMMQAISTISGVDVFAGRTVSYWESLTISLSSVLGKMLQAAWQERSLDHLN